VSRLAPLLAVLLLTSGCFRAARAWELRSRTLEQQLLAARFDVTPEEGIKRIDAHLPLRHLGCKQDACAACTRDSCFRLTADEGRTRVASDGQLTQSAITAIWTALDPEGLATAQGPLDARVDAELEQEEASFVPRFGGTFGFLAMLSGSDFGLGGRIGVRRWHLVDLLSFVAVEWTWFASNQPHQLGLMLGVELSRWGEFSERAMGAPWASLEMFVVPTLRLGTEIVGGFRAGVGLHVNQYSGAMALPFFIEIGGTGATPGGQLQPGFFADVGFGL